MSVDRGPGEGERLTADGVFSGGGIKGLAFAGALAGAAEAGYREWHQLAGTSAGAITAMTLAVGYDAYALRETLNRFDFSKLADYGFPIHLLGAIEDLIFHESVVDGDELTGWIRSLLDDSPPKAVHADSTFGELEALTPERRLVVVGADIAHSRAVEFPSDVALYQDEHGTPLVPDQFPIYKAVRISAGFPYFFPPVRGLWDRSTNKQGVFVDGGVASSFPLFVFDKARPKHPTWGFHLHAGFDTKENQPSHREIGGLDWPKEMLEGILDTATNALDKFELQRFGPRVIPIPTGEVSTLNFNLSQSEKNYLYESGLESARRFFATAPKPENSFGEIPAANPPQPPRPQA
jgi:NTE family protein